MPLSPARPAAEACSLEEFIALFREADPAPKDADALAATAPLFARLYENRSFVGDWVINDLLTGCASQGRNLYSAQSIIMAQLARYFFLRVNFWPASDDEVVKKTGGGMFAYQLPHDHNFNFLTMGYFGPGYKSDYFVYDHASVAGYPGEDVKLDFVETRLLEQGDFMVYRAHLDIHTQHPPAAMSVTVNVMDQSPVVSNQYIFDNGGAHIAKVLDTRSIPQLLNLAASLLGEDAAERLSHISQAHPDSAVRFHAIRATARATHDKQNGLALFERALETNDPCLRGWIKAYLAMLERHGAPEVADPVDA